MTFLAQVEKNKIRYGYLVIFLYLLVNNTINASSVWMEHTREGNPTIAMWEPFVWEYTSAVSTFCLLPLLFYFFDKYPPRFTAVKKQLLVHLAATIIFSILHVVIMVLLREWLYLLNDGNYDFGAWPRELWFEYRKDAWGYVLAFMVFHTVRNLYSRIKGEASLVVESEEQMDKSQAPAHFLVKKLDKEFLIKTADIQWLESCGNYVNLHCNGRIYPYRSTLADLVEKLSSAGFSRVHRSYAVCHNAIEHISYQPSGDGDIKLKSGQTLKLSRRFKDALKQSLS